MLPAAMLLEEMVPVSWLAATVPVTWPQWRHCWLLPPASARKARTVGRQRLARTEHREVTGAIGAHANLQPARVAVEGAAEVQRNGEQAVADGHGGVGDRPGHELPPLAASKTANRKS